MANYLTAKQVAEKYHVNRNHLYNLVKWGRLKARKLSNKHLFLEEDVEAAMVLVEAERVGEETMTPGE